MRAFLFKSRFEKDWNPALAWIPTEFCESLSSLGASQESAQGPRFFALEPLMRAVVEGIQEQSLRARCFYAVNR